MEKFCSIVAITDEQINGECGDNLTWSLNILDSILTITGTGEMTSWDWHSAPWFEYSANIARISLPEGLTSIGDYAFDGCVNLTSMQIPNSVTYIGVRALGECSKLSAIVIPSSVTTIRSNAFSASGITSLHIPSSVIHLGFGDDVHSNVALGATHLTSLSVEAGNPVYDSRNNCNAIIETETNKLITGCQSTIIPNNVVEIGKTAFYNCTSLTSIEIPSSITHIGIAAFRGCGLKHILIPASTSLEEYPYSDSYLNGVFGSCDSLQSVIFAEGTTVVSGGAFCRCMNLVNVQLPNTITRIEAFAFKDCSNITSLVIPESVSNISMYAFGGCTGLTEITNYRSTPQVISNLVFAAVDKSIPLYVPAESIDLYQTADGWSEFNNILAIEEVATEEGEYNISYLDKENEELYNEIVTLHVPVAPTIEGFTFQKWQASGDLESGIILQAIYTANVPTEAPAVYTNPANPAQKLIRNGNVYILTGDKTYTIDGRLVR